DAFAVVERRAAHLDGGVDAREFGVDHHQVCGAGRDAPMAATDDGRCLLQHERLRDTLDPLRASDAPRPGMVEGPSRGASSARRPFASTTDPTPCPARPGRATIAAALPNDGAALLRRQDADPASVSVLIVDDNEDAAMSLTMLLELENIS